MSATSTRRAVLAGAAVFLRYHCPLSPMKNLTPSFWSSGASYETGWDTPNKAAG